MHNYLRQTSVCQLRIDNGEWIIVFSVGWVPPFGHNEAFCGGFLLIRYFVVGQVLLDWFFSYMFKKSYLTTKASVI